MSQKGGIGAEVFVDEEVFDIASHGLIVMMF